MPSAQECAERLREQAYRTLLPQIKDLESELHSFNSSLLTGVRQLEQKLEILSRTELPATEAVLSEILDETVRHKDAETNTLALFAQGVRRRETQEEILGFLLDSAHSYFPRIALFAIRGDRILGWSSRGFSDSQSRDISSSSFLRSDVVPFHDAIESENAIVSSNLSDSGPLSFLKENSSGPWCIFPLCVMQRPVAVLAGETADNSQSRQDSLSVLAGLASLRLENIALKILYELMAEKPGLETQPAPAKTIAANSAAVVSEQAQASASALQDSMMSFLEAEPATAPIQAEVEAGSSELPPIETSSEPVPNETPVAPIDFSELQLPAVEAKGQMADEEKLHTEAKRFARLLVSEIKLYNEHHVLEGRENRDLYLRLKRDIDRSREMYEKRVSAQVSRRIDYFHDEIIRILGDNDPSTLGSDYPGPRVES
jgi:hypothetical protein